MAYSATNDPATIVEGCLEDWSWYASNDNGTAAFDVDPVYAYYGNNKDSVIVFKENAAGYLVAVSYPSNVAGQNQVENISDAIQLKPVLANPIVLDASALNTVVDFQADGTFRIASSVEPATKSVLLENTMKAHNYDAQVFPMTMSGDEMGYTTADLTDFVYITNTEGRYLMVDTTFYPNNSKYLQLTFATNALPTDYTDAYFGGLTQDAWYGRYLFKVSYFPSQDSLFIEPMNALSKNVNNNAWENADWAFNSINNDQAAIWAGTGNYNGSYGPVAIRLAYLTSSQSVVTTYNTEVGGSAGVAHPGTLQTNFNFAGRNLTYLTRTTVSTGLYFMANPVINRSIVDNLPGRLMYDIEEEDQDYNNMPATMWVVEQIGCGEAATVKITNREYANSRVFEGQLYLDEATGNIFFINQNFTANYNQTTGLFTNNQLSHTGDYTFTLVEDEAANTDPKHGYNFLDSAILPYTKYYMNYNLWENADLFLNVDDNKFTPSDGNETSYQLEVVGGNTFGYTTSALELPSLERTAYKIKVSDENLIDNDKTYIALLENGTYVPMHEDDIDAGKGKLGIFYLKADQVLEDDGKIAYILVDLLNLNNEINWSNGWQQAHVYDGTGHLSYETLENNYKSRSSAFAIIVADRPLYRDLGATDQVTKIYLERGAAYEYLFEDTKNQTGLLGDLNFNFAGLTSEGVSQNSTNTGNTTALYTIYAKNSSEFMPQYLFAVDTAVVADDKWCDDHGYNPGCTHEVDYTGYLSGRFLINLTDSITDGTNLLKDADKYKHQGYTRLGFVEGVYKIEADGTEKFYIVTENTTLAELEKEYGVIAPADFNDADKLVLKNLEGYNYYSFSLRLIEDDQENFLIESYYPGVSYIGSFEGSWIQVMNGALVLAELSTENGNHNGSHSLSQVINQAQIFKIEENVEEIPTSNEEISTISGVKVIATEGAVSILNATGKKVVISNILGQAVANTTLTSDNVTIAAPKGIVVVAVEGEDAVKAIIK
ncbi:MAG: DUF6383 domain-containing protein [Tannerellaceae bacterium]|nr:DUF6383 domain-containing protein [Tannerellaceae bacterium]